MKLRSKFIIYLLLLHALLFGLTIALLGKIGLWYFAVEAAFIVSLIYGYRLIKHLVEPLEFLHSGAEILRQEEFSTRFLEVGQPEMDRLIEVYNKMLSDLQQERMALGERRGFLEKLLEATPAGIVTFDFDGRISTVNRGAQLLLQHSADDLRGRELAEINHPLAAELADVKFGQSKLVSMKGGRRLRCMCSRFSDRGFYRLFLLMEELTEELRLSEKAAYEKLIRMMSHEVNNTVGSTNSLLDSCMTYQTQISPEDREEFVAALGVVVSRNESLNAFMRQFANVVRLPDPVPQPLDLVQLLQRVEVLTGADCRDRNITWEWQLNGEVPQIEADEHLMEQVLLNIVKNAIEAIEADGVITVALQSTDRMVTLSIIDSAGALTLDAQRQVFTPFFTTKDDGQGIGLTLVREVLTRHDFDFALESTADNRTCFWITFPILPRG